VFLCFCQINFKWFPKIPKSSRDHLKIIYGSLIYFSTMSFNIWVVNLHYKILTWYQIYLRLSSKCWKNTKTKFLIWKKQIFFLFVCIWPNSKHFQAYFILKNKNRILSYFKKYKNQLMGVIKKLWLSIMISSKYQKHRKNHFIWLIFGIWILQCNAYSWY
jgi:hypothetical protein